MKRPVEAVPLKGQLGRAVMDELTGRTGVLMAVMAAEELAYTTGLEHLGRTRWVAFLRPQGGGREWVTTPDAVRGA